jgi:hypothetical protein
MSSLGARVAVLVAAGFIVFGVVAAVLTQVMPGKRGPTDYLVIGGVATLAALAAVFVTLITGYMKTRDIFFRRRQKPRA